MRSILATKFCDTDRKKDKKPRKNRIISQYLIITCSKISQSVKIIQDLFLFKINIL
nr:MAG TPA: hypothetical protein [Caudoviricetes sp.]